jgi:hypothetical protein
MHNLFRGKNSPKVWHTFEFLKKVPKVNNRPIGEISPNLVPLAPDDLFVSKFASKKANMLFCNAETIFWNVLSLAGRASIAANSKLTFLFGR